jgi:2-dehydro-3-deoxygluconokinase
MTATGNKPGKAGRRAGKKPPSPKVIAFGELLLRLDAMAHERFVQADRFTARYTGGEANAAVSLAQWGVQTFAVSKVPDHEIGQACVNYLRRYGVNTDWVLRGGQRLGVLYVETGASQRPGKVIYDRAGSSFSQVRPREFDWDPILAGADWLHFTGTAPALGPGVLRVLRAGLRTARRLGVTVSLDCNYRSGLWSVAQARSVLPALMEYVHVFAGTRHDAQRLFDVAAANPAGSAAELRRRFGLRAVAYTLRQGDNASVNRLAGLLCDVNGCWTSRQYEMHMVDRIGGGDAFAAGLVYGLLSGWPGPRTVEFATAAGCLKHSIPGDFGLMSLAEVRELMETGQAGRVRR